jgi:hypothetical protein
MAIVSPSGVEAELRTLTRLVRAMFPHERFPDGPYERTAQAILAAAGEDLRMRAQLTQGFRDLHAAAGGDFDALEVRAALAVITPMAGTAFFQAVRAKTILTLYNDPEVWGILGYEGPSFDQGGYLRRGFDDLDWLPDPSVGEVR